MCTALLPPGVNVYCTAATGCQCVLHCCHRVSMCTALLPPGVNVYCTAATGCQCVLHCCHRASMCTALLPPGVNVYCTAATGCQPNCSNKTHQHINSQPMFLPQCEVPSFTPTQKAGKIIVLYILKSSYFWTANCKTKHSAPNDSQQSVTSICSSFLPEWIFDLLKSFPNI